MDGLNARQRLFVEAYEGNGTDACRKAGYKGSDNVLGKTAYDLLRNPKVARALQARNIKQVSKLIANREQRQEFWTEVLRNSGEETRDRLKASELLGKSEADFVERLEHTGENGGPVQVSVNIVRKVAK